LNDEWNPAVPILSISPLTTLPCSPLEQIEAAHAAGFDAVGLRLQPALPTDVDVMGDASLRRAIERKLSTTNMVVMDVDVIRVGPQTDVKALEPLLQYAGGLGATNLVFTSLPPDEYRKSDESDTAFKIAELCEAAGRHGIRPIIEFIPFRGISSFSDSVRVANLVKHPNFAICVDVLHFCRSGGSAAELVDADPQLLACLQLCDAPLLAPNDLPRESRYDRLYPGDGELPLIELLQAIPADLPISVEVPNATAQAMRSPVERALQAGSSARRVLAAVRDVSLG
jgi:sugar phosphate isomerase/epimerase